MIPTSAFVAAARPSNSNAYRTAPFFKAMCLPAGLRLRYHEAGKRLVFGVRRPSRRCLAGDPEKGRHSASNRDRRRSGLSTSLKGLWPLSPTHRNPTLLFRFCASFLLRFDARAFVELLFQEPPRTFDPLPGYLSAPDPAYPDRCGPAKTFPRGYRRANQTTRGRTRTDTK